MTGWEDHLEASQPGGHLGPIGGVQHRRTEPVPLVHVPRPEKTIKIVNGIATDISEGGHSKNSFAMSQLTTLKAMMNAKLSQHSFWHCHENGLIKTIQTLPHKLYVSCEFKIGFPLLWIKTYPGLS